MKKTIKWLGIIAFVTAIGFAMTGCASGPSLSPEEQRRQRLELAFSQPINWTANNGATWVEAINGIRNSGNEKAHIIEVTENISVPPSTGLTFGSLTDVQITIRGTGTLSLTGNGRMLDIGAGQEIIIRGDLTLQGRDSNSSELVRIQSDGILRMGDRAVVRDNEAFVRVALARSEPVGAIFNDGGLFTMHHNSSVTGNKSGGVMNRIGRIVLHDNASVSANTGDGIFFGDSLGAGTLIMQGDASVTNNTGRGVIVANLGMHQNALVSGNTNGGVFVHNNFTMSGGTISRNTTTGVGGGVHLLQGTFNMQGGTIYGNTAREGGGLFIGGWPHGPQVFNNTGGTIYGNDAAVNLRNVATTNRGHSARAGIRESLTLDRAGNWRNATITPTTSSEDFGFWLND